jgi:hypothetical protein
MQTFLCALQTIGLIPRLRDASVVKRVSNERLTAVPAVLSNKKRKIKDKSKNVKKDFSVSCML